MFTGLLLLIAFVCVALMWTEGMWSNAITFVNTVFAVLLAMNFFEPVANLLQQYLKSFVFVVDFLALWLVFIISLAVMRVITDQVSRYTVRFKMPIEHAGRVAFALFTAWLMICFTTVTVHTAPLSRSPFRGSFQPEPMANNFFGMAPDRMLLAFLHGRSQGTLSKLTPQPFDEQGDFVLKYGSWREELREHNAKEGTLRIK